MSDISVNLKLSMSEYGLLREGLAALIKLLESQIRVLESPGRATKQSERVREQMDLVHDLIGKLDQ
jgi:hypothetical protein